MATRLSVFLVGARRREDDGEVQVYEGDGESTNRKEKDQGEVVVERARIRESFRKERKSEREGEGETRRTNIIVKTVSAVSVT